MDKREFDKLADCLSDFCEDFWLERKLRMEPVIQHLQSCEAPKRWIQFIRMLETECCGKHFSSDKQWSQLLNLMQISRKINHRTLKLKHIIQNGIVIEASLRGIQQLNEAAHFCQGINSSLETLDKLLNKNFLNLSISGDDSSSDPFNEATTIRLSEAKEHLLDRYGPLVRTVAIEIELCYNRLQPEYGILGYSSQQISLWQSILEQHEQALSRLDMFFTCWMHLQSSLSKLDPLVLVDTSESDQESQIIQNLITSDQSPYAVLKECRVQFEESKALQKQLIVQLIKLTTNNGKSRDARQVTFAKLSNWLGRGNKQQLTSLQEQFERLKSCFSRLDNVLERLRLEFGRFYFLNDQELLSIISLGSRLVSEQSNQYEQLIGKLFCQSIAGFHVDPSDQNRLIGVRNFVGEVVRFRGKSLTIKKRVNVYSLEIVRILFDVLRKLRYTLKDLLFEHLALPIDDPSTDIKLWELPLQLIGLVEQVKFCQQVEDLFKQSDSPKPWSSLSQSYELKINRLKQEESKSKESDSKAIDRKLSLKRSMVISIYVHQMRVLADLNDNQVDNANHWRWLSQIRYYATKEKLIPGTQADLNNLEDQHLIVKIGQSEFRYRFDFQSLQPDFYSEEETASYKKLIGTNSSERCFLVAGQAVSQFRLGASPYGPAGSGKTETIKAFGHQIGFQVVVHNCDQTNDSKSLERLLWGLAHSGLWGCLDEFNRLTSACLSSVSASLELIQASLRANKTNIDLGNGRIMCLDQGTAFFVTLNPGGIGTKYGGRRRLPANLRSLFIPVAMMQVDISSIVSQMLLSMPISQKMSELSTKEASELGQKLGIWLRKMQINSANIDTTEWDLRLIMAIMKRIRLLLSSNNQVNIREASWTNLMISSIKIELESRLDTNQLGLMNSALKESFCLKTIPASESFLGPDFEISQMLVSEMSTFHADSIKRLMVQLSKQLESRLGVLLLGRTNSGKSLTWRILQRAYSQSVQWIALNPRSCSEDRLFGYVDEKTRVWHDGILTARIRQAINWLQSSSLKQVWIILDGPVDPDWIESLNSVLDDNQVLTLSSGERLSFSIPPAKNIKLIFETNDIQFASPATVSRLGLLLYNSDEICRTSYDQNMSREMNDNRLGEGIANTSLHSNDSESIRHFLDGSISSKICTVVGGNQLARLNLINASRGEHLLVEYNCCQYTSSDELLDLVSRFGRRPITVLLLNNVHLIKEEDCWGTKSFFELLIFMITYEIYYDKETLAATPINPRFIITANSSDQLSERILSRSIIVQMTDEGTRQDSDVRLIEGIWAEAVISSLSSNQLWPICCISCNSSEVSRSGMIASLLGMSDQWEQLSFHSSASCLHSIEVLLEIFSCESKPTNSRQSLLKKKLFILEWQELILMRKDSQSQLFHCLNWLKRDRSESIRFVFLSENILEQSDELTVWRSLGQVYHIREQNQINELFLTGSLSIENLTEILGNDKREQGSWLSHKMQAFLETASIDLADKDRISAYIICCANLIKNSMARIRRQRYIFNCGLDRLAEFERAVESAKSKFKDEDNRLQMKKLEIEGLIETINSDVEAAKHQREQIERLKIQEVKKTEEISERTQKVKLELAKVEQSIESIKKDLNEHLRPEALNEIKTLRSPPETIKDILDALFILLNKTDSSWSSMKSYMSKTSQLKDELTNYNFKERLNSALVHRVEQLMESRQSSFTAEQARRASKAIAPILDWVKAALNYGKVLIKLRPLGAELEGLNGERKNIEVRTKELEIEQNELDFKVKHDSSRLIKLQKEFKESLRASDEVKEKLDNAQTVRSNLDGQLNRWRARLASIEDVLREDELIKICAVTATVTTFDSVLFGQNLLKSFDLENLKTAEFLDKLTSFLYSDSVRGRMHMIESSEEMKSLQFIMLKICLKFSPLTVPFVDLNSRGSNVAMSQKQIIQYLTFKDILCTDANEITLIQPTNQFANWNQLVKMSIQLGKFVVLDVQSIGAQIDLDLINFIKSRSDISRQETMNDSSYNSGLIILGRLERHSDYLRRLVRPFQLIDGCSDEEIDSAITSFLVEKQMPEFNNFFRKLENEFKIKQLESEQIEMDLLNQLASIKVDTIGFGSQQDKLIVVLRQLHSLSQQLEIAVKSMDERILELKEQERKVVDYSREAMQFYSKYLRDLHRIDRFYHIPLTRYMEIVLGELSPKVGKVTVEYGPIIQIVLESMRPDHKEGLISKMRADQHLVSKAAVNIMTDNFQSRLRLRLEQILHGLMEGNVACKLMIILHDAAKSSPQMEVDEVMQSWQEQNTSNSYKKIYATCDDTSSLEHLVSRISPEIKREKVVADRTAIECICVVNAHLAHKWFNTHFVNLLETFKSDSKTLIVLIGENMAATSYERFDDALMAHADCRYWYDELSLDLPQRFSLLCRSLLGFPEQPHRLDRLDYTSWRTEANSYKSEKRNQNINSLEYKERQLIIKQLVLFHVVCQERSKETLLGKQEGWIRKYLFDYDQLSLAFKSLESFIRKHLDDGLTSVRNLFCQHLESVIYGSRMETEEDEIQLRRLIRRYLGAKENDWRAFEGELAKVDDLSSALGKSKATEAAELLTDLMLA